MRKHLYILLVTAISCENRSERLPRGSNRDKKRKRRLPESHYPRFRASDVTHIESQPVCHLDSRVRSSYSFGYFGYIIEDERLFSESLVHCYTFNCAKSIA